MSTTLWTCAKSQKDDKSTETRVSSLWCPYFYPKKRELFWRISNTATPDTSRNLLPSILIHCHVINIFIQYMVARDVDNHLGDQYLRSCWLLMIMEVDICWPPLEIHRYSKNYLLCDGRYCLAHITPAGSVSGHWSGTMHELQWKVWHNFWNLEQTAPHWGQGAEITQFSGSRILATTTFQV